jgi:uncharacterized protein (DUF427 family)
VETVLEENNVAQAIWNGAVLAESDQTIMVEGNHYFPPEAVNRAYLAPSTAQTVCSWKGLASYYNVVVEGQVNKEAAWFYPRPKDAASRITGYIAFWHGVQVKA